jgi:hypothetical protein
MDDIRFILRRKGPSTGENRLLLYSKGSDFLTGLLLRVALARLTPAMTGEQRRAPFSEIDDSQEYVSLLTFPSPVSFPLHREKEAGEGGG